MERFIQKAISLKKADEIANLLYILFGIVLSIIIWLITGDFGKEPLLFAKAMCGIVAVTYFFGNVFLKVMLLPEEVMRGLSFGGTRREVFAISRIVDLIEVIVVALPALFICKGNENMIFELGALCFGFFMWTEGLVGNNIIRYGKIAYWIYYIVVLPVMGALPKLTRLIPEFEVSCQKFADAVVNSGTNELYVWSVIAIFVIVGIVVNWLTFRKIPVKNVA